MIPKFFAKGSTVLTASWGRAKIVAIEYAPSCQGSDSFPVDCVMIADAASDNWVFTLDNGHFAYASQLSPVPVAREITPEAAERLYDIALGNEES